MYVWLSTLSHPFHLLSSPAAHWHPLKDPYVKSDSIVDTGMYVFSKFKKNDVQNSDGGHLFFLAKS